MNPFKATMIVEGVEPVETEEEYLEAAQFLIDSGLAWQLQGFFGRTCQGLIDAGKCVPA
jgi:hypothetical protein